jgi:putative heme-binding domain-containing protein
LDDVGHVIGPDLAALTDKSPASMLTAILDPNRAVEAKFVNYVALTDDGLTFSGMLASETGNSVTLVAQEGKQQVLLRGEIETLESTGKSLMPEGMEKDLSEQALADIIAYVSSQGPPRKQFEGNSPGIITPDEDGSLQLTAANAEIYGSTLVFEPRYQNLGFWQSNDDRAQWLIEAPVAGRYQVELEWACDPGTAGNALAIQAGGAKLAVKVTGTDSWDDYRRAGIGVIELKAGRQAVVVRPEGSLQGPLMDLRRLTLTPASE